MRAPSGSPESNGACKLLPSRRPEPCGPSEGDHGSGWTGQPGAGDPVGLLVSLLVLVEQSLRGSCTGHIVLCGQAGSWLSEVTRKVSALLASSAGACRVSPDLVCLEVHVV